MGNSPGAAASSAVASQPEGFLDMLESAASRAARWYSNTGLGRALTEGPPVSEYGAASKEALQQVAAGKDPEEIQIEGQKLTPGPDPDSKINKPFKQFRQGIEKMSGDIESYADRAPLNPAAKLLVKGTAGAMRAVPIGESAIETAAVAPLGGEGGEAEEASQLSREESWKLLQQSRSHPGANIHEKVSGAFQITEDKIQPKPSPKDVIEKEGLVYKGELTKGSGVHMMEHPDHPGKTAALKESELTPEGVRAKMDSKLKEFRVESKPQTADSEKPLSETIDEPGGESEMERLRRNPSEPTREMSEEEQKAAEVKPVKKSASEDQPKKWSLKSVEKEEPGQENEFKYHMVDPGGEDTGAILHGYLADKGKTAYVLYIGHESDPEFSPGKTGLRNVFDQLKKEHPEVENIRWHRTSGSREPNPAVIDTPLKARIKSEEK